MRGARLRGGRPDHAWCTQSLYQVPTVIGWCWSHGRYRSWPRVHRAMTTSTPVMSAVDAWRSHWALCSCQCRCTVHLVQPCRRRHTEACTQQQQRGQRVDHCSRRLVQPARLLHHQRPTSCRTLYCHPSSAQPTTNDTTPLLSLSHTRLSPTYCSCCLRLVACQLPSITPQPSPAMTTPQRRRNSTAFAYWPPPAPTAATTVTISPPASPSLRAAHSLCLPLPPPHRPPAHLLASVQAHRTQLAQHAAQQQVAAQ